MKNLSTSESLIEYISESIPKYILEHVDLNNCSYFVNDDLNTDLEYNFLYSADLKKDTTLSDLINYLRKNFANGEIFINDGNAYFDDSADINGDRYKKADIIDERLAGLIDDSESWVSFGCVFSNKINEIGIYLGAFDLEGFILIVYNSEDKKIRDIFY